jgi:hypothetical protein
MFAQTVFSSAAITASASFFVPHFDCSFRGGFLLFCPDLHPKYPGCSVLARHFSTLHVLSSATFIFG